MPLLLCHELFNEASLHDRPLSVVGLRRKLYPVTLDSDGMGSIPAIPKAQNVPLLLCHERFNEASLPDGIESPLWWF